MRTGLIHTLFSNNSLEEFFICGEEYHSKIKAANLRVFLFGCLLAVAL